MSIAGHDQGGEFVVEPWSFNLLTLSTDVPRRRHLVVTPRLPSFSDDAPKENPWQDDRLGFRPFAQSLSEMVLSLNAPNGYVIGLHGPWGSGKSTALKFVQAFIRKHNEEATEELDKLNVIDFRPWMVSGHQDLVAAFFKVLSEALSEGKGGFLKQGRKTLRALRGGVDPIVDTLAKIGIVAGPMGAVTTASFAGAATLGKKSIGSAIDRWLEEPSLQSAYDTLRNQLADKGGRYLIVVDDIDRLTDEEIGSIMQMVKTVGRLPNVIYLLAYDRKIVWAALDNNKRPTPDQPSFAEKIVQQELELPRSNKPSLLHILEDEAKFFLKTIVNDARWRQLLICGLQRWIRHPRDVIRLSNALKFIWPVVRGEVDAADVLSMEGLRLFEPSLFEWVQTSREFLFREGRFTMSPEGVVPATVETLRSLFSDEAREEQLELLCTLFPGRSKDLRGNKRRYSEEDYGSVVRRRGVGYLPGYNTYFLMYPSADAVSKVKVDDAMARMDDRAVQVAYIREFMSQQTSSGDPLITEYFDELYHRFHGSGALTPTVALLQALFEVADDVGKFEWNGRFLTFPPSTHLSMLLREMLLNWGEEEASAKLLEVFQERVSLNFACSVYVARAEELGEIESEEKNIRPLISADDLKRLGESLLPNLQRAAEDGSLYQAQNVLDVVRAWAHLDGTKAPMDWVNNRVFKDPRFLYRVVSSFLSVSISNNRRHYSYRRSIYEKSFDLNVLLQAAEQHTESSEFNEDETAAIEAFQYGMCNDTTPLQSAGFPDSDLPLCQ